MLTYKILVFVHVLAACVWTGGHLVLAVSVLPRALRERDPGRIQQFEEGFERIGIPALLVQIVTGLWLATYRLASWGEVLAPSSPAAVYIAVKLILLLGTLLLAAHARLVIIPRLSPNNLHHLAWHILAVTTLAVAFVALGVGIRLGSWG